MTATVDTPQTLDGRGRIYPMDAGTRLLMQFCAGAFLVFAGGFAGYGLFGAVSNADRITAEIGTLPWLFGALFSFLYARRAAVILYPDRVVKRGAFGENSLQRDNVAGYEVVPGRYGPPQYRLTTKRRPPRSFSVYQFSQDDTFQDWFQSLPDLRLTAEVINRKRKINLIAAAIGGPAWCLLLMFAIGQSYQDYTHVTTLQAHGVAIEGVVVDKTISGKAHSHYLEYSFIPRSGDSTHPLRSSTEIDRYDYDGVSIGSIIPVVYDPNDPKDSYVNPNDFLFRINAKATFQHNVTLFAILTVLIFAVAGAGYYADYKSFSKPLPN